MYADMLILQQRRTLSFAFYMSAFLPRPDEVDRIGRLLSKRVRRQ
jgi:hypothetical protein